MQHLSAEGNEMISECEDDDTRDAVMIAAAQVEHYEIASLRKKAAARAVGRARHAPRRRTHALVLAAHQPFPYSR